MNDLDQPALVHVLIVEDEPRIARLWSAILSTSGCTCRVAHSADDALSNLVTSTVDVILADFQLGDRTAIDLIRAARRRQPALPPVVLVSGSAPPFNPDERALFAANLIKPVSALALQHAVFEAARRKESNAPQRALSASDSLIAVIQALALATDQQAVIDVIRHSVRSLLACDGATFVLRDGNLSYYVDEDAVGPLFKGKRFPLNACIGGYTILQREPVAIPDIYADPRIPKGAYEATFVKSLAMAPIRSSDPLGAIGAYWAHPHCATPTEMRALQTLADSASLALSNVALIRNLEERVRERTALLEHANGELAHSNRELELFATAAAHDLRQPLAILHASSEILLLEPPGLSESQRERTESIRSIAEEMAETITSLLRLSRASASTLHRGRVDVRQLVLSIVDDLRQGAPTRKFELIVPETFECNADAQLLRIALQNLLSNAWKYSAQRAITRIEVGLAATARGSALFVRDHGAGFASERASELFVPFKRLHDRSEFPGIGIGLVTVARIAAKHGGAAWAESAPDKGATFFLQLETSTDQAD